MNSARIIIPVLVGLLTACAADESETPLDATSPLVDASPVADASVPADTGSHVDAEVDATSPPMAVFTHKMMKSTGENGFASLAYECSECTFEQYLSIEPPEGWTKGPAQVAIFSSAELRSTPSFEGVPDAVDFLPEVPGDEYRLIAKNLDATLIERGANGVVARARVMRDTLFRYDAGLRIHELTDPDGNIFVLFAFGVDPTDPVIPDFDDPAVLGDFSGPAGWTYTSRVLEEELLMDVPEIAVVLAIRGRQNSTWQMR